MKRTIGYAIICSMCIAVLAGCGPEYKDRSGLLEPGKTEQRKIKTPKTGAPQLELTLPTGMVIEPVSEADYDKYFIYDPTDSEEVRTSMLVLDIVATPFLIIKDTTDFAESRGMLAGNDIVWREVTYTGTTGKVVYQREAVQKELLKDYNNGQYVLHAFAVGSNRDKVEKLVASVESIRFANSAAEQ